ncbi:MAG: hypothetical protein ACI955_001841 [Zhongshania sp.]
MFLLPTKSVQKIKKWRKTVFSNYYDTAYVTQIFLACLYNYFVAKTPTKLYKWSNTMSQLQQAVQGYDASAVAELAAQYSFIAIVTVGIVSCFAGLI